MGKRIYRVPLPTGVRIACRKVVIATAAYYASALDLQQFDEESGQASQDDLHILKTGQAQLEVQMVNAKTGEKFWTEAYYGGPEGEYVLTHQKHAVVRTLEPAPDGEKYDPQQLNLRPLKHPKSEKKPIGKTHTATSQPATLWDMAA